MVWPYKVKRCAGAADAEFLAIVSVYSKRMTEELDVLRFRSVGKTKRMTTATSAVIIFMFPAGTKN